MKPKVLVVGAGANQIGIFTKAREMGIESIAADGNPHAPAFEFADHVRVINILDPDALVSTAREFRVDAIYPAAELAVEAVAIAAQRTDLPGIPPEVATRARNKLALRQALDRAGLPNPHYRGVTSGTEATSAAAGFGYPVIVKPSDANSSKGVRMVSESEEMASAFDNALSYSLNRTVLVESVLDGPEFCVDGLVHDGVFRLGGITGKEMSPLPFRFDKGIFMPPLETPEICRAIEMFAAAALRAIGLSMGTIHAEVIVTAEGPRIVEIAARPGGGRIPTDLIPIAYGLDFIADSLRIALGKAPMESPHWERGVALFWIEANPGKVRAIEGVDVARSLPGVREIVVGVHVGDAVDPIVDCITRDRIGYVFTEGDSAREAVERAHQARAMCRILTE